ncbi:MAG: oxidoreductase [Saprospiraceae bacterium]|nr:oxidoreductase [Saprospiraceae bacterium]
MKNIIPGLFLFIIIMTACSPTKEPIQKPIRLVTLDPGHFHAALVQKSMYPSVDSTVYIYSEGGPDLDMHLARIKNYNTRADHPTHWNLVQYTGADYLQKMATEHKGNVVVLSGNNRIKPEYIDASLNAGMHVFADKPMIIRYEDFGRLKSSFDLATQQNILLYDIMTERYEITTQLQRLFSMDQAIFGELVDGTMDQPAITKESVHHFYKFVSGNVLVRPAWFLDVNQQGEGLVDVMTHLVDLVQWECFPDQVIDTNLIHIDLARRWPTIMSADQFNTITQSSTYPEYLKKDVHADSLHVYSNGEINYTINGKHAKTSVIWNYQAPEGTGDTHYSIMRGTKCNLMIRQGKEEGYKPTLYIEANDSKDSSIAMAINNKLSAQSQQWPGINLETTPRGWKLNIPPAIQEGHEAHFARVMEKFLQYVQAGDMPSWEVPNMIAKYYTTTHALQLATH